VQSELPGKNDQTFDRFHGKPYVPFGSISEPITLDTPCSGDERMFPVNDTTRDLFTLS
jgi:hypothetical protein